MARGTGTGTRGGSRASSENTVVRAALAQKSPMKGIGNLIKAKRSILDKNGNYKSEEDVEPSPVILAMADKPIEEAERAMANEGIEYSAVYLDGKQLFVKTSSDPSFVDFNAKETKAMKGAVFTHNHPVAADGTPIPFSRGDVSMLLNNKIKSFRARSGDTLYEMTPPKDSKFWKTSPAALKKALNTTFEAFKKGYGYEPGDPVPAKVLAAILDDTLSTIDKKMGIGYKKTSIR